jgi:hypothetical protein
MSHFSILEKRSDGGDPTTWLEPVDAEAYDTANQQ